MNLRDTFAKLAWSGNIEMLERHETLERSIELTDDKGRYGVHLGALRGRQDVVEWFLDREMDVNIRDSKGRTFGYIVAFNGYFDILRLFLERGGEQSVLQHLRMNAIQERIFSGASDDEILNLIQQHIQELQEVPDTENMIVSKTHRWGFQATHFAAHFGRLSILRALVEEGANINAETNKGYTPFILAAQRGHREVLEYLHDAGANVNAVTKGNANAAHFVAATPNIEVLSWLDEIGVDFDLVGSGSRTVLNAAILANQYECCRWLLEEKGVPSYLDAAPELNLTTAFRNQSIPIARLLIDHNAPAEGAPYLACSCFHTGLLDLCLEKDISFEGEFCPSVRAIASQDWDAFDWMIAHDFFRWERTAFMLYQLDVTVDSLRELKRRGFDFHVLNDRGQNLFFSYLPEAIVDFLLSEGLDPNIEDIDGKLVSDQNIPSWKLHKLIVGGGLYSDNLIEEWDQLLDLTQQLPIDISFSGDVRAAHLRMLSLTAIRDHDEELIRSVNEQYPMDLQLAALVCPRGIDVLMNFGIEIDYDALQMVTMDEGLTYLAEKCQEQKFRCSYQLNRIQLM